jgi:hypothetical protein
MNGQITVILENEGFGFPAVYDVVKFFSELYYVKDLEPYEKQYENKRRAVIQYYKQQEWDEDVFYWELPEVFPVKVTRC